VVPLRRIFRIQIILIFALLGSLPSVVRAEKEIRIPAGQSADVWWGVNVSGNVHYVIRTRDESNTVKFWWIKWGVGSIEEVGSRTDVGAFKIPISIFRGVVAVSFARRQM
jgi:hypothetical protein